MDLADYIARIPENFDIQQFSNISWMAYRDGHLVGWIRAKMNGYESTVKGNRQSIRIYDTFDEAVFAIVELT